MASKVIEARAWKHGPSGRLASLHGACPWGAESERIDWAIVSTGWTVAHPDGTTGIGRVPFKTREEAQAWVDAHPCFPGMSQG